MVSFYPNSTVAPFEVHMEEYLVLGGRRVEREVGSGYDGTVKVDLPRRRFKLYAASTRNSAHGLH